MPQFLYVKKCIKSGLLSGQEVKSDIIYSPNQLDSLFEIIHINDHYNSPSKQFQSQDVVSVRHVVTMAAIILW